MSRLADDLGLSDQIFPLWVLRRPTADRVRLVSRGSGGLVWPGICWKGCRTVGPVAPSALVSASVSAEVEVRVAGMRREHPRRPALDGRSVWTGLERDHASCSRGSVGADRARSSRAVRALGERLQVWAAVVVGGCGEVELPGAGQHGDDEREVAHDQHHGERLQQPRAGKIQRHRRARDVGQTRFTDRCRGKCRYQARWPARAGRGSNGRFDANGPEQRNAYLIPAWQPVSGLRDGRQPPDSLDPLQGMRSAVLHRDVGAGNRSWIVLGILVTTARSAFDRQRVRGLRSGRLLRGSWPTLRPRRASWLPRRWPGPLPGMGRLPA
jgi:hypothetical protein